MLRAIGGEPVTTFEDVAFLWDRAPPGRLASREDRALELGDRLGRWRYATKGNFPMSQFGTARDDTSPDHPYCEAAGSCVWVDSDSEQSAVIGTYEQSPQAYAGERGGLMAREMDLAGD